MLTLGDLERSIMELLWESDEALSAYELQDQLAASVSVPTDAVSTDAVSTDAVSSDAVSTDAARKLAPTTILTVLSRLEKKHFVVRERASRPHRYRAERSRADHMAELMHQVLGGTSDRTAVLERFIGQASQGEADTLRKLLDPSRN